MDFFTNLLNGDVATWGTGIIVLLGLVAAWLKKALSHKVAVTFAKVLALVGEISDVIRVLTQAVQDGKIDEAESKQLQEEMAEVKGAVKALMGD